MVEPWGTAGAGGASVRKGPGADAGVGWTGPRAPGSPSRSDPRRVHAAAEVGAAAGGAPAFVHGPRFPLEPWGSLPSHSFPSSFFSSSPLPISPELSFPGDSRAASALPRGKLSKSSAQGLYPLFLNGAASPN